MKEKTKLDLKKYAETLLLFMILCILLKFVKQNADFKLIDLRLVYVVLVASMYGMKQAILAIVLTCINYLTALNTAGIDITYLFYSVDSWMPFAMYVLVGGSVGYNTNVKKAIIEQSAINYEEIDKKYIELKESYKDLFEVKQHLQKQITISKNSFSKVYEISKELDMVNPKLIFYKAISILENTMENDYVCIYSYNAENTNFNRLIANSFKLSDRLKSTLDLNELPKLQNMLEQNKMFVNTDLDNNYPTYAAPIMDGKEVVAFAMIYNVDFEKHTLYYQNLFQVLVNLIQDRLVNAFKYNDAYLEKTYIAGTKIYKSEVFNEHIQSIEDAREDINLQHIKGKVELIDGPKDDISILSDKLSKVLRSTDFAGINDQGRVYAVFMQTDPSFVEIIKKRFEKEGILLELEDN